MDNRFVVVTGASTGIGRACAVRLDREGFSVFATVRKPSDGDALKTETSERLHPLLLDVTDSEAIAKAIRIVGERSGHQLHGLVNNAGIGMGGPLECMSLDTFRHLLEVNVIGLMAMTQACLPLLKPAMGRIVNIGSSSGLIALPLMSMYAGSKFAVHAVTDSLRIELKPFGIPVSLIAPGKIQSAVWEKARTHERQLRRTTDPETLAPYEPFLKYFEKRLEMTDVPPAEEVAKVVAHALLAKRPRPRYVVGKDAVGAALFSRLPVRMRDWMITKILGI